jgi:hypothetical protein
MKERPNGDQNDPGDYQPQPRDGLGGSGHGIFQVWNIILPQALGKGIGARP